jgi:pyrroloquinoline-quinone synthase
MDQTAFKNAILSKQSKYHIHHPYHIIMNSGGLTKEQVQIWVANRFYYQEMIPRKDAAILMNCNNSEIRQEWVKRIQDHDELGGIEAWIALGESVGLTRDILFSHSMLLPGVKFAVDAYYYFCKDSKYQDSMTSSLTELFAPEIHQVRLDNWPTYYPWIDQTGYNYFKKRLNEARRDVNFTLNHTLEYYKTEDEQKNALRIIDFKLDILWCMLDSISIKCKVNLFKQ